MTFALRDVPSLLLLHADWPTHLWSRSRHHGNNVEITKILNVTFLMCLFCNILFFWLLLTSIVKHLTQPQRD